MRWTLWLWLVACASAPPPAKCPEAAAPIVQAPVAPPVAPKTDSDDRTQRACDITAILFEDLIRQNQLLAYDILRDADVPLLLDNPRAKPDDPRTAKAVSEAMAQTIAKIRGPKVSWLVVTTPKAALVSSQPFAKDLLDDPVILSGFAEHKHNVWVVDGAPHLVVAVPIPREKRGTLVLARAIDASMVQQLARSVRASVRVLGDGWNVSSNPRTTLDLPRAKALAANRCQTTNAQAAHAVGNAVVVVEDAL